MMNHNISESLTPIRNPNARIVYLNNNYGYRLNAPLLPNAGEIQRLQQEEQRRILIEENIRQAEIALLQTRLRASSEKLKQINLENPTFENLYQETNSSNNVEANSNNNVLQANSSNNVEANSSNNVEANSSNNVLQANRNNINMTDKDKIAAKYLKKLANKFVKNKKL